MILHMLSQRSDTDLLSVPKVVTKSGQEAIMKVVTEYLYPTEFEVQEIEISGGGGSGSTPVVVPTSFMVEPKKFEKRDVGVILQVVPEVSAEGQMINLMLNPRVVSEPVWKNYGTKIPGLMTQEYTDLPMEQPFFHVRSVQTQLSVYNGATVVMGGLITEDRKTMEDKIPFLGDIPYLGRLFRSRSEQSIKRNLLVFVTARLVDPAGRVVKTGGESALLAAGASSTPSAPVAAPVAAQEGGAEPNAAAIQ
jgi:general secretion pathway protein D